MTPDLRKKLRAAAQAGSEVDSWAWRVRCVKTDDHSISSPVGDFIAAVTPSNVLALLREVDELGARVAELEGYPESPDLEPHPDVRRSMYREDHDAQRFK